MTGELSYALRSAGIFYMAGMDVPPVFTGDAGIPGVAYVAEPNYEVALLSAGIELSGNGYARASLPIGTVHTASWARSGTLCTVTTAEPHNLAAGTTPIEIMATDDYSAVTFGTKTCTRTSATEFTFACLAAGATSGTLAMEPPSPFWALSGSDPDLSLVQIVDIVFPAASGGSWSFDVLRLIRSGASGGYEMRFVASATITVADGNTLTIAAGALVVNDLSSSLA